MKTESSNDVELVERSRDGDREAFGRIVEKYQSLVCALTYSACGNLQASEDLAQVTFITAWCELPKLKEPSKLKSWLCGIARNVTNNSFRQDKRTPTAHAEALDVDISADAPTPRDHVISKEEEAILWRSLSELPATYREPLVLFYRQHQSVAEVAGALELSEDAVKQRLSRGRAMLAEQVTAFVEGALRQTTPGKAFTLDVLAGLPALTTSAKAAVVGATAAQGSATAKAGGAAGLSGLLSSILGVAPIALLGGWIGRLMSRDESGSPQARDSVVRFWRIAVASLAMCIIFLLLGCFFLGGRFGSRERLLSEITILLAMVEIVLMAAVALWAWRHSRESHRREASVAEEAETRKKSLAWWVVLGMIGAGTLLVGVLWDANWNLGKLSTAEVQKIIEEHRDAEFIVFEYPNGRRDLWLELRENGRVSKFIWRGDEATLSRLAKKGIAYSIYVQGRDFEILGWPARFLAPFCVFILAIGAVILLKRPRNKASVS